MDLSWSVLSILTTLQGLMESPGSHGSLSPYLLPFNQKCQMLCHWAMPPPNNIAILIQPQLTIGRSTFNPCFYCVCLVVPFPLFFFWPYLSSFPTPPHRSPSFKLKKEMVMVPLMWGSMTWCLRTLLNVDQLGTSKSELSPKKPNKCGFAKMLLSPFQSPFTEHFLVFLANDSWGLNRASNGENESFSHAIKIFHWNTSTVRNLWYQQELLVYKTLLKDPR